VNVSIYAIDETNSEESNTGVRIAPAWDEPAHVQDRIIASPLQVGDQVFVGTADNFVLALDAATGSADWPQSFETGHSIWGQPNFSDGVLYVSSLDKNVYALDSKTGQEVWPEPGRTGGSISDKADLDGNMVYVGSFDGHVHAMDRLTGEIIWSAPASAADSDNLTAVWGAPVLADGFVYFVDLNGTAYAVNADDGRQLWTQSLVNYATAAPVIFEDSVFVALAGDQDLNPDERQGALVALEVGSGKELWRQPISAPVFSTPVIADDAVVIAYRSPEVVLKLDVFELDDGSNRWSFVLSEEG
jgi:outer membrane protein assembly factor BamB